MGPDGVLMLTVSERSRTRVLLSCTGQSRGALPEDASAEFAFGVDQVARLLELGVQEHELAEAAFRDLLDQMAAQARHRTAFMRAVRRRLLAGLSAEVEAGDLRAANQMKYIGVSASSSSL